MVECRLHGSQSSITFSLQGSTIYSFQSRNHGNVPFLYEIWGYLSSVAGRRNSYTNTLTHTHTHTPTHTHTHRRTHKQTDR